MTKLARWLTGALLALGLGCGRVAPGTSMLARPSAPLIYGAPCPSCGTASPASAPAAPLPGCGPKQYDADGHVVYQFGDLNCR